MWGPKHSAVLRLVLAGLSISIVLGLWLAFSLARRVNVERGSNWQLALPECIDNLLVGTMRWLFWNRLSNVVWWVGVNVAVGRVVGSLLGQGV